MNVFDNNDYDTARKQYEAEAKERYGKTDAYKEFEQRTANHTKADFAEVCEDIKKQIIEYINVFKCELI